jgi:hypothetical protein
VADSASKLAWKVVAAGAAFGATAVSRKVLDAAWSSVRGTPPPDTPENPDTGWGEAVTWAVLSGVGIGVARLVATRTAARVWVRRTGALPPGLVEEKAAASA